MHISLDSNVALVTGASRGIGAAIADRLAECGAHVIGTATTEQGAAAISTRFNDAGLANCRGAALDVTNTDQVDGLIKSLSKEGQAPDILVNNAGITRDTLLMRMKDSDWQAVLDTNLTAIFRLSKACMRAMMKARHGRIINIGSVVGTMGNPGQANYAAAKAGLIGFSKALAQEVGSRGITVNTISPGFIQTDMTADLNDSQRSELEGKIPLGRLGQGDDIASAVAFLASPLAGYITGETLHVNGGMHMV